MEFRRVLFRSGRPGLCCLAMYLTMFIWCIWATHFEASQRKGSTTIRSHRIFNLRLLTVSPLALADLLRSSIALDDTPDKHCQILWHVRPGGITSMVAERSPR